MTARAELGAPSLPRPAVVLELLKPITWFAPMWAFGCGVVSANVAEPVHWLAVIAGIALAGPLICGTSQAVNDWFDREVDAINEPGRPIPSGRIPGAWGLYIAIGYTLLSLGVARLLGMQILAAAGIGLALAWAYSAPPLRLKMNGWWGNAAVAISYEGLAWVTGAALRGETALTWQIFAVAGLYSAGAHGIMTLNDFKSVDGDLRMGVGSLPARLGVEAASRVACVFMLAPQIAVVALLLWVDQPIFAGLVSAVLVAQIALMPRLLKDPKTNAPWYNATGTSLYVLGMMAAAVALHLSRNS